MLSAINKPYVIIPIVLLVLITNGCNTKPSINVTPAVATVELGQTLQFKVSVKPTNAAVEWSVDEGDAWGTISDSGIYTAPVLLPSPAKATVRVAFVADSVVSATAQVTITGEGAGGTSTTTIINSGGIGSPCGTCNPGLTCITEAPDGYCTKECSNPEDCGQGTFCYQISAGQGKIAVCLIACRTNADCRPGYSCQGDPGSTVCYPGQSTATTTVPGGTGGNYTNADLNGCYPKQSAAMTFKYWFNGAGIFSYITYNPVSGTVSWGGSYQVSGGPANGQLQLTYDDGTVEQYKLFISADKSYLTLNGQTYYYSASGEECE